jgi:hypothetical protein
MDTQPINDPITDFIKDMDIIQVLDDPGEIVSAVRKILVV